jgi:hypothetical protein
VRRLVQYTYKPLVAAKERLLNFQRIVDLARQGAINILPTGGVLLFDADQMLTDG